MCNGEFVNCIGKVASLGKWVEPVDDDIGSTKILLLKDLIRNSARCTLDYN